VCKPTFFHEGEGLLQIRFVVAGPANGRTQAVRLLRRKESPTILYGWLEQAFRLEFRNGGFRDSQFLG
jgi:hypothetical protein